MLPKSMIYVPRKPGKAALAEVQNVQWSQLGHAFTGADDLGDHLVPPDDFAAVLAAFFGDGEEREEACDAFLSSAVHQGTIYEVTAHLVPFLAAFAAGEDDEAGLSSLYCLLHATAGALCALGSAEASSVFEAIRESQRWLGQVASEWEEVTFVINAARNPSRELVDDIEGLIDGLEPAPPEYSPPNITRAQVEEFLRTSETTSPFQVVSFAWKVLSAGHTDLAEDMARAHREGRTRAWAELLIGEALFRQEAFGEAQRIAQSVAEEWLAPPTESDSANQVVQRDEVAALLGRFHDEKSKALFKTLMAAPEPEVYIPPGDFF